MICLFSICRKKHEINYNFLFLIRRQENQRLERILVVLINFLSASIDRASILFFLCLSPFVQFFNDIQFFSLDIFFLSFSILTTLTISILVFIFSPRKHHHMGRGRSREDEMQDHRAMVHERQLRARLESKRKEQALDEEYDRMVNGGGGYRKLRKGEHYEDVQKEFLENEIRIRERRKQYRGPPPDQDYHRQSHYHQDHRDHNYRDRGGRDHYRDQPRHYRR